MERELDDATRQRIETELAGGRTIQAIKIYRDATDRGLKESRDAVLAMLDQLRLERPAEFATPQRRAGCVSVVAFAMIAVVGVFRVGRALILF